ncbi:gamma-butyrobetaine hydroxylase-like domain-containing protein [Chitinasiproducens palmae]|uniref:DUF971 family protein n=1 Tax=Chitinasiproducens palmae TaxID=1770053 RepID=A0A1H2PNE9_9BURK|nr:DUF971 domain-containing protein [Chitinasiproducens palmae]SDV48174.1 DUF971 family protein [Chitinasiproducens palmae]
MAGLSNDTPVPTGLVLHRQSRALELQYEDGRVFRLPCEFLRVYSPSAEVVGHGPGQETLQTGKREVSIDAIEPVGNYAIKPVFSDGHASGLYSWDYLYNLAIRREALWQQYLDRLQAAGASREPLEPARVSGTGGAPAPANAAGGCGSGCGCH